MIFQTHSPDLLFNFTARQIRQVVLDDDMYSVIREKTNLGRILDDLGYGASDLMNVSFVFIVEGKQDKSRLPLLLENYYSEIRDQEGRLSRISIITTNSCTNIKTYANLKYMNQVYIRDQFQMCIRDRPSTVSPMIRQARPMTTIPAPLLISADFWYWPTTAPERAVKALEIQSPTVMVNTGFTDDARTISPVSDTHLPTDSPDSD